MLTLSGFNFDVNSGWTGKGLKFDGVNDNCNTKLTNPLSFEAKLTISVVTTDAIGDGCSLLPSSGDQVSRVFVGSQNNYPYAKQLLRNPQPILLNGLVSFGVIADGENVYLHENGKIKATAPQEYKNNRIATQIFHRLDANGISHSIKIYNVALTPEEIAQNYEYEQSIDRTTISTYPMLQEQKSYGIGLSSQLTEEQLKIFRLSNDKTKFVAGLRCCKGLKVEEYTYAEILKVMETEEWRSSEETI